MTVICLAARDLIPIYGILFGLTSPLQSSYWPHPNYNATLRLIHSFTDTSRSPTHSLVRFICAVTSQTHKGKLLAQSTTTYHQPPSPYPFPSRHPRRHISIVLVACI